LQRVLFIGYPLAARSLTGFLARHPEIGFKPVGYLDMVDTGAEAGVARLGSLGDLEETVGQHRPDWIVIEGRVGIAAPQVDDLVDLRFSGLHVEDLESFFERTTGRAHAASLLPSEPVFAEGLLPNPVNVRLQSIYATLGVLVALPIALPLMGVVALATRVTSRGPVFLRDRRVGLCGHPFTMYRFRVTSSGTGIGRLATHWGLDRLPQLWNVLRGDMSLIGPEADRPEFAGLINQAIPFHRWRLLVLPGMIGWAQIHKATDGYGLDVIRRLEYDLYYMKNLSPLLDLFVLLRWIREALPFSETGDA
jgi:lipopolysaccharide/colanic/teichoic acid biosynthesis glycosyltransferase